MPIPSVCPTWDRSVNSLGLSLLVQIPLFSARRQSHPAGERLAGALWASLSRLPAGACSISTWKPGSLGVSWSAAPHLSCHCSLPYLPDLSDQGQACGARDPCGVEEPDPLLRRDRTCLPRPRFLGWAVPGFGGGLNHRPKVIRPS